MTTELFCECPPRPGHYGGFTLHGGRVICSTCRRSTAKGQKAPTALPAVYASCYVRLVPIANMLGYALAAHGSLNRDGDFIAVPWTIECVEPERLVDEFAKALGWLKRDDHGSPGLKPHGRLSYTIVDVESGAWLDLAVMSRTP